MNVAGERLNKPAEEVKLSGTPLLSKTAMGRNSGETLLQGERRRGNPADSADKSLRQKDRELCTLQYFIVLPYFSVRSSFQSQIN